MEKYLFPGDTRRIIESALTTLGLDFEFLASRTGLPSDPCSQWNEKALTASDWIHICDVLHLPTDSICTGYNRRAHKARISFDRRYGLVVLPRTFQYKALLTEIRREKRINRRWEDQHFGFRLRWRVRWLRMLKQIKRTPLRVRNQIVLTWHVSRKVRCYSSVQESIPTDRKIRGHEWHLVKI